MKVKPWATQRSIPELAGFLIQKGFRPLMRHDYGDALLYTVCPGIGAQEEDLPNDTQEAAAFVWNSLIEEHRKCPDQINLFSYVGCVNRTFVYDQRERHWVALGEVVLLSHDFRRSNTVKLLTSH